jgi:lysophospholipase L1-like esterase
MGKLILFVLSLSFAYAHADIKMETFGDSLTVAFLANTNATAKNEKKAVGKIYSDLAMYKLSGDPKYIAPYQRPEFSWPVILSELMSTPSEKVVPFNFAVSGAKTTDLLGQVQNVARQSKRRLPKTIAFFFIGHNDLCSNNMTDVETGDQYEREYAPALEAWEKSHTGSLAFLVPVGKIYEVYETLKDHVWLDQGGDKASCIDSWKKYFPYCTRYADLQKEGKLKDFLAPRIDNMNSRLEKMTSEFNAKSQTNHYAYLGDLGKLALHPEYFAIDCFHMSYRGQTELADGIYQLVKHY